jgi:hypothetical protein
MTAFRVLIAAGFVLAGAGLPAAEPGEAIKSPAERAAWDAIAARFSSKPVLVEAKGKGATIKLEGLKNPRIEGATGSVQLDAAGHVVNVTANRGEFTNDEFEHFAAFPELASLTLWHNGKIDPKAQKSDHDGSGLAHLAGLKKLTRVTLAGGGFSDAGMAAAAKLPALTELHIWHSSFTDAGVAEFRNHPRLEVIKIGPMWTSDLTDRSLEALAGCPKLRHIQIEETHLTWDGGLKHLAEKPGALAVVDLKNCLIEPAEVEKLRAALPKVKVEWEGLAGAGAALTSNFARGKAAKWMPKDLLARAAAEADKAPPAKK